MIEKNRSNKCQHYYNHLIFQCTLSETKPGDAIDNDCDGNIDEEIRDGKDNDGDGEIDEDLALVTTNHFK